jgi:hypothetical protein
LGYYDIDIVPSKFKSRVRIPKVYYEDEEEEEEPIEINAQVKPSSKTLIFDTKDLF